MKNPRREAVNYILRVYENDAAKISAVMKAEQLQDDSILVEELTAIRATIDSWINQLHQPEKNAQKKAEKKVKQHKRGRPANPDREDAMKKIALSKRRNQLRQLGYIVAGDSMVAYHDKDTRRRLRTEQKNKYGFIFKPKN